MTRKIMTCFAAMLMMGTLTMGLASLTAAQARDLTVVSWGGPLQEGQKKVFFKPFTETAKIPLQDVSWDGGVGVLRTKVQGGNLDWDVVQVESDELAIGCEEGLFVKLDWSKLGGKDIYLPETVSPCGVGAVLYSFVLGYDADALKDPPKSWADFFDLQKYPGRRGLRRGPKVTLEIALMADGVDPKDVYKVLATDAGVARAFKKLDTIKSSIVWWQIGNQPSQLLASHEVVMTDVYNGRITAARREHKNFGMVWNQSLFAVDSWVILKGSPNVDNAYKLLDFMSDPHRQADFVKDVVNGMSNKATAALLDKDALADLPTAPQNFVNVLEINVPFWLENYDKLNDLYTKWAAQ